MAVLQMQRVSICALKKDRKSILEKLQSMGILEISQVADEDDAFSRMDTMNARVSFEKKANIGGFRRWMYWMDTLRSQNPCLLRWKAKS